MNFAKLSVFFLISLFISCKTASINNDTANAPLLTITEWKMEEIRFLQKNTAYYYKRNSGADQNMNFENDYIKFNKGGTGVYHQTDGKEYIFSWHFDNDPKTAIEYVIENFRNGEPLVVHWEHIKITKTGIKYSEYYTHADGTESLAYAIRSAGKN